MKSNKFIVNEVIETLDKWVILYLVGYAALWKMLDVLITEFKRRGGAVPQELIEELRTSKSMISILDADPSSIDTITEVEILLGKIESTLLYLAEADFGKEYANEYSKRIIDARAGFSDQDNIFSPRFVTGIPRGMDWIRFKTDDNMNRTEVEELAHNFGLLSRQQDNDSVIIYGDKEKIREFIQRVAEKIGKTKKK
ncbi:MAG: hypothetical protein QG670_822 [Thermoproteota archaeon]|nr:hypothetical protein [Thermoproteota archaeon]